MKTILLRLTLLLCLTALPAQTAAQVDLAAYPPTVVVTNPISGTTVGRQVTFTGTAKAGVGLYVSIDGLMYLSPADRSATAAREYAAAGVADGTGRFSLTLDLSGLPVSDGRTANALPAGRHMFVLYEQFAPNSGKSAPVALTVMDATGAQQHETEPAPATSAPSPTPSASPTIQPLPTQTKSASEAKWVIPLMVGLGLIVVAALRRFRRSTE